jgi:hypothetical protein
MEMSIENVNWLSVLAGGVIAMLVGGLWYGPIAGRAWMAEMGLTEEEIKASGNPTQAMIKSFIAALVFSFGIAFFMAMPAFHGVGWKGGMMLGFVMAILIHGAGGFPNYAFENKTLRHFLIHIGNTTVSFMAIGAMMGAWQ